MKLKYVIAPLAFAVAVLSGCQESAKYEPVIYMTDAQAVSAKTVTIDETPAGVEINVSASEAVEKETTITLELRPDLVEEYNAKYGKNYAALPEGSYAFDEHQVTIKAGFTASSSVDLIVTSIDDFKEGTTYCMPVSIQSTNGSMSVLEPSRTLFVVLKTPVISKAIYLGSSNIYKIPGFLTDASLKEVPQVTLECRVFVDAFAPSDPFISSIMGIEGECAVRFGDVKIPNNVLQICHGNYQPAATSQPFSTGKWYHVAAVWNGSTWAIFIDGKFATETPTGGEAINLSSDNSGGFQLGASYGGTSRPLRGYIAEARVWTRALSANEIANNMNYIDPTSKGLLAYWRMNAWEPNTGGSGNIVRDLTGNGYDAYGASGNPTMIDTRWM